MAKHGLDRPRVLVAVGETDVRQGLCLLLESLAEIREAASGEQALRVLAEWRPHVMVADLTRGAIADLLRPVREHRSQVKVLMIGNGTIELAAEAMRQGAAHFVSKPFDNQEILAEIQRLGQAALAAEEMKQPAGLNGTRTIIAKDPRMLETLELVWQVAPTAIPVLIFGESGTGKELIARAIHDNSRDPSLPFLPINTAALPDTLLESELFGHVKGAFTGADTNREGIFAKACGGTVFLDEIALMSLAFQGKLLRVLQEHTVTPLGSSVPRPVSFRQVASTNRSLRERVAEGTFREDLYYRLKVVTIEVPPLRKRPDDIVPLAMHFLALHAGEAGFAPGHRPGLTAGAVEALQRHRWPGNVRELQNSIQRALIVCRGEDITAGHLHVGDSGVWTVPERLTYEDGKQRALAAYQRHAVERALRATRGNVTQAAAMCDLSRAAFQRIMRSLGVDRHQFNDGEP